MVIQFSVTLVTLTETVWKPICIDWIPEETVYPERISLSKQPIRILT